MAAGDVKQGHRQEHGFLRRVRLDRRGQLAGAAHDRPSARKADADQVGHDVALAAMGAFRPAGGARRVEDRGVVLGVEAGVRQGLVGEVKVGGGRPDQVLEGVGRAQLIARRTHGEEAGEAELVQVWLDSSQAFGVGDQHLGGGVGDAIGQVLTGAPSVQRRHHRADGRTGPERDRPFGQVAHGDDDAVTLFHPVLVSEHAGERRGRAPVTLEGQPLLFEDDEVAFAPLAAGVEHGAQVGRSVLVEPRRPAADHDRTHFIGRARRRQHLTGLGNAYRRRPARGLTHRRPPRSSASALMDAVSGTRYENPHAVNASVDPTSLRLAPYRTR